MDQLAGELNVSKLEMVHSAIMSEVTTTEKEDKEFKSRKRCEDDDRDHAHRSIQNAKILAKACHRQAEIQYVDDEEVFHCRNLLSEDNCHKK